MSPQPAAAAQLSMMRPELLRRPATAPPFICVSSTATRCGVIPSAAKSRLFSSSPLVHSISSHTRQQILRAISSTSASEPPLDLTEDNINLVLSDARIQFGQIFDRSVGMTGEVELAELDGPFIKLRLRGRFWHERSLVLARLANYLKQRIPEILEVDIEDEKQLDDSPENF
uniref:Uncharacterized protein n=1 Tax=Kalanchoe fedtschenkoi TaxID=63787 RepID=A0A7N0THY1_KALFE